MLLLLPLLAIMNYLVRCSSEIWPVNKVVFGATALKFSYGLLVVTVCMLILLAMSELKLYMDALACMFLLLSLF